MVMLSLLMATCSCGVLLDGGTPNASSVKSVPIVAQAGSNLCEKTLAELQKADWLCPRAFKGSTNVTVEFRCEFSADSVENARMAVSADSTYAVRLNGRTIVESARTPDTPPRRFYDVWQLAELRPGVNLLEFSLYSPGIDTSRFMGGDPGIRFVVFAPAVLVTSSGPVEWRKSTKNRSEGVPLQTAQLGFTFEYDAAALPGQWRKVRADERRSFLKGESLERRPVRPPEVLPFLPGRVVGEGRLDGSPLPEDVAAGMDATKLRPQQIGGQVASDCFSDGFYYLVDFGREEVGLLEFELETDEGAVIDIGHAEHAECGRIRTHIDSRRFAGRYRAKEGVQTFCRWQYRMAGRYVQLHVRGVKTRFNLHRIGIRPVLRTDVARRQVPVALSERQRKIWDVSVRTLMLSMHEHYEDCPWREQALYANDAHNQILAGYYAFKDDGEFAAFSLDLLSRGLGEDGWLELCMPARIPITIPSFTFSWMLAVADHFRLYRNRKVVLRMLPIVKAIIEMRLGERRENGLLPCPTGERYWQFYDWAEGLDGDLFVEHPTRSDKIRFDAPLNFLFLRTLVECAKLMDEVGENETASRWRAESCRLRVAVRSVFWNEVQRCFRTCVPNRECSNAHELTQALGLLTDSVPEGESGQLAARLAHSSEWVGTTLGQSIHKFLALIRVGQGVSAVRQMDETWTKMLDAGATSFWEMKEGWRAFEGAGSLCHGWSAIPVYVYGAHPELLHIR